MPTVVGVKLRFTQKPLWFDPADLTPAEGDIVVVQTERGKESGTVVEAPHDVEASDLPAPLKAVLRIATESDLALLADLAQKEREALPAFREMCKERKLDMKPIDVEYMLDGDKVVFYFAAEERVDFRELVKALASRFKSRVDMRQVGVRDEARMIGGLGHCGEQLCCSRFGGEFMPVSIRMAKEQDLPLNPLKISGLCGRLMCCLRYEFEAYRDYKQRAPKKGAIIETPLGKAQVVELNTPHESVVLRLEDGKRFTVLLGDMECGKGGECPCSVNREVLEQAGGTGIALALSALDRENEPEPEPVMPAPKPRKRRGGKDASRDTGKGASRTSEQAAASPGSGAKPAPADAAEAPPARKRRRRGGRGSGGGTGAQAPTPTAEQPTKAKPTREQQAPAAEAGGEGGATRPGRRRRRRRPGTGGGTGSEGAPTE
jgi:cell fate regulator YaaT (PSP1 superfamily)